MCKTSKKEACCQNPKELKGDSKNCSKEQIQQCHGTSKDHPCCNNKKENRE